MITSSFSPDLPIYLKSLLFIFWKVLIKALRKILDQYIQGRNQLPRKLCFLLRISRVIMGKGQDMISIML